MGAEIKIEALRKYREYIELYKRSGLPVLICDENLNVCWPNPAMETLYPRYAEQEGFDSLVREFDKEKLLEELNKEDTDTVWRSIGINDIMLGITPVTRDGSLYCAVAGLVAKRNVDFPGSVESSKAPIQLAASIRENVSQILREIEFARIDSVAGQTDLGLMEERFGKITLNTYNLLRTTTNITDFTDMNIEKIKPKSKAIDMLALISRTSDKVKELAAGMGIPVEYSFPDTDIAVITELDADMFESAFFEILHNALYFTREGNYIKIKGKVTKNFVSVAVCDHGVGISKENLPFVFTPYFTCGQGPMRAGIGLGLTLAKDRIEAMNGSIKINSKKGSRTTVTITFKRKISAYAVSEVHSSDRYQVIDKFSPLYVNLIDAKMSPYAANRR